ncbi:hypothetical protein D9X30_2424 [Cupriavidus sp. U2]|uniref:hypothetical protein n=1 Tax=Cupriavidus sp. U2 TaxID=2920269 RepID=UPI00129D571A|nr:hypothetical protein [Cupriavidus sp. U2]KAI3592687.1 hypothetical protein D9X30_2424 [Cupriavidus sp. U2]
MKMKETYLQVDDLSGNGGDAPGAGAMQDDVPAPRIKASEVVALARDMGVSKKKLIRALGFDRGEILHKAYSDGYLDSTQSELVIHFLGIIAKVNELYFDGTPDALSLVARREMARFLDWRPFTLGCRRASGYFSSLEGQALVKQEIVADFFGVCP